MPLSADPEGQFETKSKGPTGRTGAIVGAGRGFSFRLDRSFEETLHERVAPRSPAAGERSRLVAASTSALHHQYAAGGSDGARAHGAARRSLEIPAGGTGRTLGLRRLPQRHPLGAYHGGSPPAATAARTIAAGPVTPAARRIARSLRSTAASWCCAGSIRKSPAVTVPASMCAVPRKAPRLAPPAGRRCS